MAYTRLTNMRFDEASKKRSKDLPYIRLALLEDAIEDGKLIYQAEIIDVLKRMRYAVQMNAASVTPLEVIEHLERRFGQTKEAK